MAEWFKELFSSLLNYLFLIDIILIFRLMAQWLEKHAIRRDIPFLCRQYCSCVWTLRSLRSAKWEPGGRVFQWSKVWRSLSTHRNSPTLTSTSWSKPETNIWPSHRGICRREGRPKPSRGPRIADRLRWTVVRKRWSLKYSHLLPGIESWPESGADRCPSGCWSHRWRSGACYHEGARSCSQFCPLQEVYS